MEISQYLAFYNLAENMDSGDSQLDIKSDFLRVYQHANSLYLNTTVEELERAKEKEKLLANRILGATAIGLTGIGGMQLATAIAEEKADEQAEMQMKVYLSTFRCDYADGKNIVGGETGFVLPGGNELWPLVQEYKRIVGDLKSRKEILGLKPGIESEAVLDRADSGVYDDEAIGKIDGVFTSLSRALSDEKSEDTAEWVAQREETSQKKKTGAGLAVGGTVGGLVGNVVVSTE